MPKFSGLLLGGVAVLALANAAHAVIIYGNPGSPGDVAANHRNTVMPVSGSYANSGWQYEVTFAAGTNTYAGTAIASSYFITAKHFGAVSGPVTLNGIPYTLAPASGTRIGTTDLMVYKINGSFPVWAPLYNEATDGLLAGKTMVVYGCGAPPNTQVTSGSPVAQHNGWRWGAPDGLLSWGTNVIDGKTTASDGTSTAPALRFSGALNSAATEGLFADKDSGGGVFVQGAGGVWKLAGVNWAATPSIYSYSSSGSNSFAATIFNPNNLYSYSPTTPWPAASTQLDFSTSTSDQYNAITQVIPEPGSLLLVGASTLLFALRRRELA